MQGGARRVNERASRFRMNSKVVIVADYCSILFPRELPRSVLVKPGEVAVEKELV